MKRTFIKLRMALITAMTAVISSFLATSAMAVTAPTDDMEGTVGYAIYDIIFNQIYSSGLQYVIAGALLLWAAMQVKQNWKEAVGWGIGAMVVAALTTILTGLGAVA